MTQQTAGNRVAVFLDRDGVINRKAPENDYIKSWREFSFLRGVDKAISSLNDLGYLVFIVTNQRGVARGLMSLEDLESIHRSMLEQLKTQGATIAGIYSCTHDIADNCDCRKPRPGLLLRAAEEHGLNLGESWMVGDRASDVQAGRAAGCKVILIRNEHDGHPRAEEAGVACPVVTDLQGAVELIIERNDR